MHAGETASFSLPTTLLMASSSSFLSLFVDLSRCCTYTYYLRKPDAPCSYGTRSPLKNIRARGRIIFLFFPRAARARAENKANQQCHFKSSRWHIEQLDTDSCRGTVPMEPPMPNCSMRHRNPVGDFDDTRMIL